MQDGDKRSNEFKRYRQVLTGIYLGTAALGLLLLAASVVKELWFRTPARELVSSSVSGQAPPDPKVLLACQNDVLQLLSQLSKRTSELMIEPVRAGDASGIATEWEEFSRSWVDSWDTVDARCGFSDLAGTNLGAAYDRMAKVHSELPSMKLKYQSILLRFDEEHAAELARMRRSLDRSRRALVDQFSEADLKSADSESEAHEGEGAGGSP